jgi:hypothetical protein
MGDLRWCAIESLFQADTINFSVTGTINLAAVLPTLTRSVSIEGPGADLMTVRRDTGGNYRIFTVATGVTSNIAGLTITNGNTTNDYGGGISNSGTLTVANCGISGNSGIYGGVGLYNTGSLTISNSTISGNSTTNGSGGGIYNTGTLTLTDSTVSGNSAPTVYGGGVINTGTLTVTNSTVANNSSSDAGGGIDNLTGTLTLTNSTVSGNSTHSGSGFGGGISNFSNSGTFTVSNSTISGNSAPNSYGGGIYNNGVTLTISDSSISDNTAGSAGSDAKGGGIYVGTSMAALNTIISGNTAPLGPDVYGKLGSQGYNLIGNPQDMTGWVNTDLLHVDPLLGLLQDNGGPTKTYALLPGSPAINAGDPTQLGVADQRGVVRSGGVNIGAYQASASAFVLTAPGTVAAGVPFDLAVTAVDPFGQVAVGYTGTVTFTSSDTDSGVVLPVDYTFTSADAGMVTFPGGATLITDGHQTITATDTVDGTITGTATVTVTSGLAPLPLWGVAIRPATPGTVCARPPTRQAPQEPSAGQPAHSEATLASAPVSTGRHAQDAVFDGPDDPVAVGRCPS